MDENPYKAPQKSAEVIAPYAQDEGFYRWGCACLVVVAIMAALFCGWLAWRWLLEPGFRLTAINYARRIQQATDKP